MSNLSFTASFTFMLIMEKRAFVYIFPVNITVNIRFVRLEYQLLVNAGVVIWTLNKRVCWKTIGYVSCNRKQFYCVSKNAHLCTIFSVNITENIRFVRLEYLVLVNAGVVIWTLNMRVCWKTIGYVSCNRKQFYCVSKNAHLCTFSL